MKWFSILKTGWIVVVMQVVACHPSGEKNTVQNRNETMQILQLDDHQRSIQDKVKQDIVIAHRGWSSEFPESTEPAYQWAVAMGVDYLEADLQRTRDGVIIVLHDENLRRTTNVEEVFPDRANDPVNTFTLSEIKQLDAGSWFTKLYPDRDAECCKGLKILTLDELLDIAEGGGEHKPGVYLETKKADLFPGIEKELYLLLKRRNWIDSDTNQQEQEVSVGNSPGKLILQTFEKNSLPLLNHYFPETPKLFLLWKGEGGMERADSAEYSAWLDFAIKNGAQFIGTSITGEKNQYYDLTQEWMVNMIHERGLKIHAYTFDTQKDIDRYQTRVEGLFTNDAHLLLRYFNRLEK